MSTPSKRDILLALAGLAAASVAPAFAQTASIDLSAGRDIGRAYLAARRPDAVALRAELLPRGMDHEALPRLRARAANDFREGRIFTHRGWMLSETEAQLFALLAS